MLNKKNLVSEIAGSIKRKAKKFSDGGEMPEHELDKGIFIDIDYSGEEEPEKKMMNKGGACYAMGGEVHPLAAMFKKRYMSHGGETNPDSFVSKEYPTNLEVEEQKESRDEAFQGPRVTDAKNDDEEVNFLRRFKMMKAMGY